MNALNDIQKGSILVEGQEVNDPDLNKLELRKKLGMVFQQYNLFPHKTALENIMMAPLLVLKSDKAEVEKLARDLIKKVRFEGKEDSYPGELSGGQQQRVAIARSSIMAGRVNPVICMLVQQVAFMVHGHDTTVSIAALGGQMEINHFEPVIAHALFNSIDLLVDGCTIFREKCIETLIVNEDRSYDNLVSSFAISTVFLRELGYVRVSKLVKDSVAKWIISQADSFRSWQEEFDAQLH